MLWVQIYQIWNWTIKVALGWTTEGTELVPLRVYMQIRLTQVRRGNTHITLRVPLWAVCVCVWSGVKSGLSVEWCRAKWREWGAEGGVNSCMTEDRKFSLLHQTCALVRRDDRRAALLEENVWFLGPSTCRIRIFIPLKVAFDWRPFTTPRFRLISLIRNPKVLIYIKHQNTIRSKECLSGLCQEVKYDIMSVLWIGFVSYQPPLRTL